MTLYSIPPFLSLCCFLALAVLVLMKQARTRLNRVFFLLCILASFLYASFLFSTITRTAAHALWASRIEHLFIPLLLPLYLTFFQEYLGIMNRNLLVRIAYGVSGVLICLAPTDLYIPHMTAYPFGFVAAAGPLYFLFVLDEAVTTLYVIALVYRAIGKEKSSAGKNRLKYVLVGFGSLGVLNGLNYLAIYGLPIYPPGEFSFIPLAVFAVGLYKHDLLDMGFLIRKSLIYSCLTALLTCLYAVLIITANRLFSRYILPDSMLLPVIFFLLITFIFGPMKSSVQRVVDRLFSKEKYDYRVMLKDLGRQIVSVLDTGAIGEKILSTVTHAMKVESCTLFIRHPGEREELDYYRAAGPDRHGDPEICFENDAMVRWMKMQPRPLPMETFFRTAAASDAAALSSCRLIKHAAWAFPLAFKDHLNGFLLIGEKRSGDLFTPEDLDLLETVCGQSALAIENALSYQQIERLNSELEKKVADRTYELRTALEEKERTQEQLIRSESLAAIGQLVAGVAHELNNPLTSAISLVQSTIEALKEQPHGPEGEETIEDMGFAEKELARAKSIVRSLLGLSRQTDTYRENVNLNSVVKDASRILNNQYKNSNISVEACFDDTIPDISGNFATLGQVALNIIQNAIHAVSGSVQGQIVLTTRHDASAREIIFECADSGPGMPPSVQKDIFKPFFTTKEVGQGTGLGLYISHEIVRKHGGTLSFESVVGRGSRFVVRLPATVAA